MDEEHGPERLQGVAGERPPEGRRGERATPAGLRRVEDDAVAVRHLDVGDHAIGTEHEAEGVLEPVDRQERGHVEPFGGRRMDEAARSLGELVEQVPVGLPEGVADLGDDERERAIRAVAEPPADGIEDVPEHPEVGQHPDGAIGELGSLLGQPPGELGLDRQVVGSEMVAVPEPHGRRAPVPEATDLAFEDRQLVDVEEGMEGRIPEGARHLCDTAMPDPTEVEPRSTLGGHHGHRTPRWLTARTADHRPSSWKP